VVPTCRRSVRHAQHRGAARFPEAPNQQARKNETGDDVLITDASQRLDPLRAETLAGMPIIVVSFGGEQEGAVEGFISERGLARRSEMYDRASFERATSASKQAPRIPISLPDFLALPAFLDGSGMSAIVPRPLADSFARTNPISIHELPNTACVPCTCQPREVALPTLEEIN
jgi:hypothetical protein